MTIFEARDLTHRRSRAGGPGRDRVERPVGLSGGTPRDTGRRRDGRLHRDGGAAPGLWPILRSRLSAPLEEYLQWLTVEKGRSRATTEAYRRDLSRLGDWMSEHRVTLDTLDAGDLEAYFDELGEPRSAGTVARALSSVRGWLGFLVEEGRITQDPSSRLKSARRARSLPKPLSEEEMARLLDAVDGEDPIDRRDRALLELLYGTGARVSEAVGLRLEDLDFDEELILVTGKGSRQRLVPMGAGVALVAARVPRPGWATRARAARRAEVGPGVPQRARWRPHATGRRRHSASARARRGRPAWARQRARVPPQLRDAHAGPRRRHPRGPGAPGSRLDRHDADLHRRCR